MNGNLNRNIPHEIISTKNEKISGLQDICNSFNQHFIEFECPSPRYNELTLTPYQDKTFYLMPTTPKEIEALLVRITSKPAAGIDEIGGQILKSITNIMSTPLSYLINESFSSGQYPDALKISKSIPVFKNKGSRNDISNYRNICLQSQIAKVIDSAFNTRLNSFLESNKLLSVSQHGFRTNRSTSTAIADLSNFIYDCLNNKQISVALFFDLSRAFDTIDHVLLIEKLNRIGVRGMANKWVESYLSHRQQTVVIGNFRSDLQDMKIGVPQGSILGPLLFLIFINDMPFSCKTPNLSILYADDANFGIADETTASATCRANTCADEFYQYCLTQGLLVNTSKTFFMSFLPKNICQNSSLLVKLNHQSVTQVNYIKFLGVTFDHKMTWEQHIDNVSTKLSRICFVIRQLRNTVTLEVLKLAYFGLVQSVLSYGIIYWGNAAHIDKAFIMQKKVLRCMMGLHPHTSCRKFFIDLSILTLPSLYVYCLVLHVKKQNFVTRNTSVHGHNTRNKNHVHQPFSRLTVGQNSYNYQGAICFNRFVDVSGDVENFNIFKNNLYRYLINNAFYSLNEYLGQ